MRIMVLFLVSFFLIVSCGETKSPIVDSDANSDVVDEDRESRVDDLSRPDDDADASLSDDDATLSDDDADATLVDEDAALSDDDVPFMDEDAVFSDDDTPFVDEDESLTDADADQANGYYYPPLLTDVWEKIPASDAGLNQQKLDELITYVGENNSTAFMILYKGRVVVETYWSEWNEHRSSAIYSAAKSITSTMIGLALEKSLLTLDQKVGDIVGVGWSGAPADKESVITVRHLMTMTSGLEDKATLKYVSDAGTEWVYNTKAYYVLGDILEKITGSRTDFTDDNLWKKIGMRDSQWVDLVGGTIKTMKCSGRDMARFGLLILSDGEWDGNRVINQAYLDEASETSQEFNLSYGYLFWLNGKDSVIYPRGKLVMGSMIPSAPDDMVSALGANDKKIYVVPSLDLVVIRHGAAADESSLAGSEFDEEIWKRLKAAF